MPQVPRVINDGNHSIELEIARDYSFPFSDRGDFDTFEVIIRYEQDKNYFRPLPSMSRISTNLGSAYLVEAGDPRDVGLNLFQFDRVFSSIPKNREEGASVPFTNQWWRNNEGTYEITEQTFIMNGFIRYEYFDYRPAALIRPRAMVVFGSLLTINGGQINSSPAIVDDSEVGIYKGGIFYRKTAYVYVNAGGSV